MTRAWHAAAAYAVISIAGTWPLVLGLGRDIPWDLGDPLFVTWALTWDCEQLLAILAGDFSRAASFFDAGIFHPAPLTLAYSEHFVGQALQVLPVYAATRNPILCYNLLFLSTFVLSGLGTYLLVRELTGSPRAAFVAGLLYAFAPYRFPQSSHLQVLSSQWMPFAFFGLHRFFATVANGRPRVRPLAGAAAALVAQHLSCVYYLMYFAPFAAAFVAWEIARRRLWRQPAMWLALGAAAVVVGAATAPFLLPYVAVQRGLALERSRAEVIRYSADVYSYATAPAGQPVWGYVARSFPKPEGELFPGLVAIGLAIAGLVGWRPAPAGAPRPAARGGAPGAPADAAAGSAVTDGRTIGERGGSQVTVWPPRAVTTPRRRLLVRLLAAAAVVHAGAALAGIVYRRITLDLWLFDLRITDVTQMLARAALLFAALLAVSPAARARTAAFVREQGFFAIALAAAAWLSLGPAPQVMGRPLDLAPAYALLQDYVPGFDGLRVPARFAMIVTLMLAVLGGYGAAVVARFPRGGILLSALAFACLAESLVLPFPMNVGSTPPGFAAPEPRVYRPARAPAAYHALARLPAGSVIAELPLGYPEYDLRAMFYSSVHRHPLVNGYSGFFPPHYPELALGVSAVPQHPAAAAGALRAVGTTHVLVHEAAYLDGQGAQTTAALRALGAAEIFRDGSDVVLELPGNLGPA